MKKAMTRTILIILGFAMALTMAACGEKKNAGPADLDFSQYPANFAEWTQANMKAYLRDSSVFTEEDWLIDVSANELTALGAAAGSMYVDMNEGTTSDIVFFYDAAAEGAADILAGLRESHMLMDSIPMDAMLGSFCFSYSNTVDEEHKAALIAAIKDLAAHYDLTPDFITE